jgi:hypothetical protein
MLRLYGIEFDICMLELQWSAPEWKFDFVSEKIGRPFDMHQLNHITVYVNATIPKITL